MQTYSIYAIALFLLHGHQAYFVRFPGTWTILAGSGIASVRGRGPVVILQGIRFPVRAGPTQCSAIRRTAASMPPAITVNPTVRMYHRATPSRWSRDTRATSGLARITRRVLCGPYGRDVVSRPLLSLAKAHLGKLEPRGRYETWRWPSGRPRARGSQGRPRRLLLRVRGGDVESAPSGGPEQPRTP